MRYVLFLAIISGLFSCEKKKIEEKKYPIHIISEYFRNDEKIRESSENGEISIPLPPIFPKYLYASENFILDDSSNIYYYQLERFYDTEICGTGMEEEMERDSIPVFKKLIPEQMIQIPINSINEFVKLNIRKGERNLVKIASQKDTLKSKAYFKLLEALDKNMEFRADHDLYVAYRTTQEEDTVLHYKKHKKDYDSDSVKWDKKRIKFLRK